MKSQLPWLFGGIVCLAGLTVHASDLTVDNLYVNTNATIIHGVMSGNGAGITNVPASGVIGGRLSVSILPTNGVWNLVGVTLSNLSNLTLSNNLTMAGKFLGYSTNDSVDLFDFYNTNHSYPVLRFNPSYTPNGAGSLLINSLSLSGQPALIVGNQNSNGQKYNGVLGVEFAGDPSGLAGFYIGDSFTGTFNARGGQSVSRSFWMNDIQGGNGGATTLDWGGGPNYFGTIIESGGGWGQSQSAVLGVYSISYDDEDDAMSFSSTNGSGGLTLHSLASSRMNMMGTFNNNNGMDLQQWGYLTDVGSTPPTINELSVMNYQGWFGLGMASPQYPLDANGDIGNSTSGDYQIGANGDNTYLNASNGGNVGIGTQNPTNLLHVVGGNIQVQGGQFVGNGGGLLIPPQGDLAMGSFTNGIAP